MQGEIVALNYAHGLDYSSVRREDKPEVERIIAGLVTFESTMPALDIDIHDAGDHYNISAKGYSHQISIRRFYEKFEGENSEYDFILGTFITPSPSCIVMLKVKKRDFSDSAKSKRSAASPTRGRSKVRRSKSRRHK